MPEQDRPDLARLDRPAPVLAPIAAGSALALLMWTGWLLAHALAFWLHGGTAAVRVIGPVAGVLLLLGALALGRWNGRRGAIPFGIESGLVAGLLGLALLGSKLAVQPESTAEMTDAANRVRPDAALIAIAFLVTCTLAGVVGAWVGSRLAPADKQRPTCARSLAFLAGIATCSMLPLLMLGGAVTGTKSGMAVPDGVTSFGAVSVLFPLSLMSDPSIFLEHSHRLFGTLVGLITLTLAIATLLTHRRGRVLAIGLGVAILVVAAGTIGLGHAGAVSKPISLALLSVVGLGALGFTHAMISRGVRNAAAMGLGCLVAIQGLMGIARVDENLEWMAAIHGVFGQLVFATGAMLTCAMTPLATLEGITVDDKTLAIARKARKLALFSVIAVAIQVTFGAVVRHFPSSNHALISHIVFSLVVVLLVLALGVSTGGAPRDSRLGRVVRAVGIVLLTVVFIQFCLGWVAFWATHMNTPSGDEAGTADGINGVDATRAVITTAHQTFGALVLAGSTLALFWTRRAIRVGGAQGD